MMIRTKMRREKRGETRVMMSAPKVASCLYGLVAVGMLLASSALASPRSETLELLRGLEERWPGGGVSVRVLDGAGRPQPEGRALRIGETLSYDFESQTAGYLTAIHLDTQGAATLLYPRVDVEAGRVGATPLSMPSAEDGFDLTAQPPVGRDVIYAVVTKAPVARKDLGIRSSDLVVSYEAHQAADVVRRLRKVLDQRAASEIAVAHVVQQIDGRGEVQYRSADIVSFFGERTRSIRPPKLDLQIYFGTDSAELDAQAKRNIDEFAAALEDPKLAGIRFKVAGHTDDTGSAEHNLELSRKRAKVVRQYLIENGIPDTRLEIEAHGENNPLMSEQDDYARQMNRRVEFAPAR